MQQILRLHPYGFCHKNVSSILGIDFSFDLNTEILLEFFVIWNNCGIPFNTISQFISPNNHKCGHSVFTTLCQKAATLYRIPFFIKKVKETNGRTSTIYFLGDFFAKKLGLMTIEGGELERNGVYIHSGSRRGLLERGSSSKRVNHYVNTPLHVIKREKGLKRIKKVKLEDTPTLDMSSRWNKF